MAVILYGRSEVIKALMTNVVCVVSTVELASRPAGYVRVIESQETVEYKATAFYALK